MKFDLKYFLLSIFLFLTEICIAKFLHGGLIRENGGDFLVVIFIYCAVKAFFDFPVLKTALGVLIFAYVVEISQYFHLISLLGLQKSALARIIFGTTFSFADLFMYTLGMVLVVFCEWVLGNLKPLKD